VSGVDVVVVAAGASARMGGVDKLGVLVAGRPLLAWTLGALAGAPTVRRIVVVTSADRIAELAAAPWLPPQVEAVVSVVLPWSTWPIVPTFTCGFVRSNLS